MLVTTRGATRCNFQQSVLLNITAIHQILIGEN